MIIGHAGAGPIISGTGRWICPIGVIQLEGRRLDDRTDQWDLFYVPIDDGASVVSA